MALLMPSPATFCAPASERSEIQSSTVRRIERGAPHKTFTSHARVPSKRPRNLADPRLTVARIKWNRVTICGRTKRWNSAGE
jgi:hypothetical protein